MKKSILVLLILISGCQSEPEQEFIAEINAEAELYSIQEVGENQYTVLERKVGTAYFGQSKNLVRLTILLEGMEPNTQKAVHIHNGSLEALGGHWNQGYLFAACDSISMGRVWDKPFLGDIGNVSIGGDKKGKFVLFTDLWKINSGDRDDVLNKVIIVHKEPSNFANECTPFHKHNHVNDKIAGGVISLVSDVPENEQLVIQMEKVPAFLICK